MSTLCVSKWILLLWSGLLCAQEVREYQIQTIVFYNLENLFDFEDDPTTFDDDRTPEGKDHWTEKDYEAKLQNMAYVISEIGKDVSGTAPALVGVCEIENRRVLEDLLNQTPLLSLHYGIIHFDSPDIRGIDVALLYRKKFFTPSHFKKYELKLFEQEHENRRIFTRDQLVVSGFLGYDKIHLIVNHWPSRRGGEARSRSKRIRAAQLNKRIIDSIFSQEPYAKIVSMGDFNDDPTSKSIKGILGTKRKKEQLKIKQLYNPMEALFKRGQGSLAWRDRWNLFDQIIISSEWIHGDYSSYRFYKAGIYNKTFLANARGRFKGYPFRSFTNGAFTGGYSDHFPVYLYVIKQLSTEN